jgi:hypothetical protein
MAKRVAPRRAHGERSHQVDKDENIIPIDHASVVTPKPANGGQGKTGQRKRPGTQLFYPAASCGGKSIFVRQLRGPHLRP